MDREGHLRGRVGRTVTDKLDQRGMKRDLEKIANISKFVMWYARNRNDVAGDAEAFMEDVRAVGDLVDRLLTGAVYMDPVPGIAAKLSELDLMPDKLDESVFKPARKKDKADRLARYEKLFRDDAAEVMKRVEDELVRDFTDDPPKLINPLDELFDAAFTEMMNNLVFEHPEDEDDPNFNLFNDVVYDVYSAAAKRLGYEIKEPIKESLFAPSTDSEARTRRKEYYAEFNRLVPIVKSHIKKKLIDKFYYLQNFKPETREEYEEIYDEIFDAAQESIFDAPEFDLDYDSEEDMNKVNLLTFQIADGVMQHYKVHVHHSSYSFDEKCGRLGAALLESVFEPATKAEAKARQNKFYADFNRAIGPVIDRLTQETIRELGPGLRDIKVLTTDDYENVYNRVFDGVQEKMFMAPAMPAIDAEDDDYMEQFNDATFDITDKVMGHFGISDPGDRPRPKFNESCAATLTDIERETK